MGAAITQDGGKFNHFKQKIFSFWIIARILNFLQSQKCTE